MTRRPRLGAADIRPEPAPTVNRTLETAVNQPTETARALLWRHGLPEDVIDGALCLHAQELAAVQRKAISETDDPVFYEGEAGWLITHIEPEAAAPPAVVSAPVPPTDQTAPAVWIDGHPQLEAIAHAVREQCRTEGTSLVVDDPRNIAVAALAAVLPDQSADLARAQAEAYQYRTALQGVARRAARMPAPADRAAVLDEAADALDHMSYDADSNDYGYDTYRDAWDGDVTDGAAELRRLAAEARGAQQDEAAPDGQGA